MIAFVTSNPEKAHFAQISLATHGIEIERVDLELEELQSDDENHIISRKAQDAFTKLQRPLIVSDHCWDFPALNGFPGPYMHFINDHLTAQDLLKLMENKTNRTAMLREYIAFTDGKQIKIFTEVIEGIVLSKAEGKGLPGQQIISLSQDQHSIAYHLNHGSDPRGIELRQTWKQFADWYKNQ